MSTPPSTSGTPGTAGPHLKPGDEAAPGTIGTGEDICPVCRGSGMKDNGECPNCEGTGRIVQGVGGG